MLLRFFCSLLALSVVGCTRPPLPAPIAVSTQVPARLTPVRVSITGQVLDADTRRPVAGVPVQDLRYSRHPGQSVQILQVSGGDFTVLTDAQGHFAYATAVPADDTSRFLLFVDALQYGGRAWHPLGPAPPTTILLRSRPRSCCRPTAAIPAPKPGC